MSFSKTNLLLKSAGNTQEAVARPNMTVKLFTGTLRIKLTKQINNIHSSSLARCTNGCKPFGHTFCITGFWMALGVVLSIQVLHIYRTTCINQAFAEALKDVSFQNDLYVLHGRSPSKDTIISKIHTFFYNLKHSVETLSVYISLVW